MKRKSDFQHITLGHNIFFLGGGRGFMIPIIKKYKDKSRNTVLSDKVCQNAQAQLIKENSHHWRETREKRQIKF